MTLDKVIEIFNERGFMSLDWKRGSGNDDGTGVEGFGRFGPTRLNYYGAVAIAEKMTGQDREWSGVKRESEAFDLLVELVKRDPWEEAGGVRECQHCRASHPVRVRGTNHHKERCPWLKALEVVTP